MRLGSLGATAAVETGAEAAKVQRSPRAASEKAPTSKPPKAAKRASGKPEE